MNKINQKRKKGTKIQKIYRVKPEYQHKYGANKLESLDYQVECPLCEEHAFDISDLPASVIVVQLDCPHCGKIVDVPLLQP